MAKYRQNAVRSKLIGTLIGIIPGGAGKDINPFLTRPICVIRWVIS